MPGLRKVLPTLPPVLSDQNLYNQPPEGWKKKPYSLKKPELLARLMRYASAQQLEGANVKWFTVDNILTALKQVHLARSSRDRWSPEQFIAGNGLSGNEYENEKSVSTSSASTQAGSDGEQKKSGGQQFQDSSQTSNQEPTSERPDYSRKPEPPNPNPAPPNPPATSTQSQVIDLDADDEESKQPVIDGTELNVIPTSLDGFLQQRVGIALNKVTQDVFYQPLDRQNRAPKYGLSFNLASHGNNLNKALDVRFPMKGTTIRLRIDGPGVSPSWQIAPRTGDASQQQAKVNNFQLRRRGPV